MRCEIQLAQHLIGFAGNIAIIQSIDTAEKTNVLRHSHIFIEGEFLTHIADVALDLLVFCGDVETRNSAPSFRRLTKSGEHTHCCGLACTVGAEESEYLAAMNSERNVVDSTKIAERFYQMLHANHIVWLCCQLVFNHRFISMQCLGIKHFGKTRQYSIGRVDGFHPTVIEKSHALTTSDFVEIRRGRNNRNASCFERNEHFP